MLWNCAVKSKRGSFPINRLNSMNIVNRDVHIGRLRV